MCAFAGDTVKRGAYWLTGAMRFRSLWEDESGRTVVVCDVHDDTRIMAQQIRKILKLLDAHEAQAGITFWPAR